MVFNFVEFRKCFESYYLIVFIFFDNDLGRIYVKLSGIVYKFCDYFG